jgi:hypothetical protein
LGLARSDATISAVSIPIKTSFTDWNEDTEVAYQSLETVWDVPIATVVSLIAFGAFYYHFGNLQNWDEYTANIKHQTNTRRWHEASISSAIMVFIYFQVFGVIDMISLIMVVSVQAGICWFIDVFEWMNVDKKPAELDFTALNNAMRAGGYTWLIFFWFIWKSTDAVTTVPVFGWGLVFIWGFTCLWAFYTIYNKYEQKRAFADTPNRSLAYIKGELIIDKIWLVGRTAFVWCVLWGCQNQTVY